MNNPATEVTETSKEDKFFGVRTTIGETDDSPPPEVVVEDEPTEPPKAEKEPPAKPPAPKNAKKEHEKDDPELAEMSEKVQKRIAKMRWKQGEIERERDALRQERDEAFRVAQTLHGQNTQYANVINTGEARLVEEIKQRAANDLEIAKTAYAAAYEKGDTESIIKAQEMMLNANADVRAAQQYGNEAAQRQQQFKAAQQQPVAQRPPAPAQRQVPSVPKPSDEASTWADENPWFGDPQHPDMTALAYGVHEKLVKHDDVMPDTPEYFQQIDATMRAHFPDYFSEGKGSGTPVSTQKTPPATVVASGQREAATAPRKVKLTATQVKLAKRLGITVEQYAKQLIKGN